MEKEEAKANSATRKKLTKSSKYVLFGAYLTMFHSSFIILMGFFARYKIMPRGNESASGLYPMFMDVHSMIFIGFGFLMTFLKRYGYSSVGFNFLIASYVLEWALLVKGWMGSIGVNTTGVFEISTLNLLVADFVAAAVLISFGAVIGKTSLSQLLAMATIEVVLQAVNEHIGLHYLHAYDIGESIYVHVFGAYFGLAVSRSLQRKKVHSDNESSNYHSDLFSIMGTLFLWLYWPSFNSATAVDEGQTRAIVNTFLSISASCIVTFILSLLVGKGKLNMVHIQNATLAGGVAVGAVADMAIQPYGALIIGSLAGVISTLGFQYLTPYLNHRGIIHDTCGVNNLHGMPGLFSGIASAVVAALASKEVYEDRLYVFYPSRMPVINSTIRLNETLSEMNEFKSGGLGRSALVQGGYQIAALIVTLCISILGGVITGFIMRLPIFEQGDDIEEIFNDEPNWILPDDFHDKNYELVGANIIP